MPHCEIYFFLVRGQKLQYQMWTVFVLRVHAFKSTNFTNTKKKLKQKIFNHITEFGSIKAVSYLKIKRKHVIIKIK